jgi:hypothetical protein
MYSRNGWLQRKQETGLAYDTTTSWCEYSSDTCLLTEPPWPSHENVTTHHVEPQKRRPWTTPSFHASTTFLFPSQHSLESFIELDIHWSHSVQWIRMAREITTEQKNAFYSLHKCTFMLKRKEHSHFVVSYSQMRMVVIALRWAQQSQLTYRSQWIILLFRIQLKHQKQ